MGRLRILFQQPARGHDGFMGGQEGPLDHLEAKVSLLASAADNSADEGVVCFVYGGGPNETQSLAIAVGVLQKYVIE